MLNLKAPTKVKIYLNVSIFFLYRKNFLILMEFRTSKVVRKVLLELFLENYAIKVSYFVWKQVCWVQNSICAFDGILGLHMLLVKYYGYGEYKD